MLVGVVGPERSSFNIEDRIKCQRSSPHGYSELLLGPPRELLPAQPITDLEQSIYSKNARKDFSNTQEYAPPTSAPAFSTAAKEHWAATTVRALRTTQRATEAHTGVRARCRCVQVESEASSSSVGMWWAMLLTVRGDTERTSAWYKVNAFES